MTETERRAETAAEFWELAGPVNRKVYNFIRKSLGPSPEADDVFQETILQAFRYFPGFRRGAKFETWLFAIAHNEVRKHFKRASRDLVPPDTVPGSPAASGRRAELVREVYRFAASLGPRQREVFFLFYDDGFSVREISEITRFREGNVKFILNQARQNLKTMMGEKDE